MRKSGALAPSKRRLAIPIALFGIAFPLAACSDPCSNRVTERLVSPDGEWIAILFVRDCGATTGFSTQLTLTRADVDVPEGTGNVFVAGRDKTTLAAEWGGPWAGMEWAATAPGADWPDTTAEGWELIVTHDASARIFASHTVVDGVPIRFEAREYREP